MAQIREQWTEWIPAEFQLKDPDLSVQNWDCPEALDLDTWMNQIRKSTSSLLNGLSGQVDRRKGCLHTQVAGIEELAEQVFASLNLKPQNQSDIHVLFLEGFLLYADNSLFDLVDEAFLFDIDLATMLQRRNNNREYSIQQDNGGRSIIIVFYLNFSLAEQYWKDPDGYVEVVVYPAFKHFHRHLHADSRITVLASHQQSLPEMTSSCLDRILRKLL
jgi:hypothetical protein